MYWIWLYACIDACAVVVGVVVLCYVWTYIVSVIYIVFCMGNICNHIGDICACVCTNVYAGTCATFGSNLGSYPIVFGIYPLDFVIASLRG